MIASYLIFNKIKKALKDRNIFMKDFFYIDFEKKILIIDKIDFSQKFEHQDFAELKKQYKQIEDVKEVLITQRKIQIKLNNNEVVNL